MLISHRFDSKSGSSLLFKVLIVSSGILRNRKRDWNKDLSGLRQRSDMGYERLPFISKLQIGTFVL